MAAIQKKLAATMGPKPAPQSEPAAAAQVQAEGIWDSVKTWFVKKNQTAPAPESQPQAAAEVEDHFYA